MYVEIAKRLLELLCLNKLLLFDTYNFLDLPSMHRRTMSPHYLLWMATDWHSNIYEEEFCQVPLVLSFWLTNMNFNLSIVNSFDWTLRFSVEHTLEGFNCFWMVSGKEEKKRKINALIFILCFIKFWVPVLCGFRLWSFSLTAASSWS